LTVGIRRGLEERPSKKGPLRHERVGRGRFYKTEGVGGSLKGGAHVSASSEGVGKKGSLSHPGYLAGRSLRDSWLGFQ